MNGTSPYCLRHFMRLFASFHRAFCRILHDETHQFILPLISNYATISHQSICRYKYPNAQRRRYWVKIHIFSRQKIWWIALRKRNTDGVVPRTSYANPG